MSGPAFSFGRETRGFRLPIRQQRGGGDEKVRLFLFCVSLFQYQQQGQNLYRLAQPHVVGKTCAQSHRANK